LHFIRNSKGKSFATVFFISTRKLLKNQLPVKLADTKICKKVKKTNGLFRDKTLPVKNDSANQGDQMSVLQNRPKCGPTFLVKSIT
jgi:hypothetical protein